MARYECVRQIECLIVIEADDEEDLKLKLPATADELLEQADGVAFATAWNVQREDSEEVIDVTDDDIEDAKETAAPWVKE